MSALRPYQSDALSNVFSAWRDAGQPASNRNALGGDLSAVCLVSPTGSGKTRMGVEIAKKAKAKGHRVLWIAHRRELIKQAKETLEKGGAPGVLVESIQTLLATNERPEVDLLVVDECHHIVADEWKKLVDHYSYARILGLTATPTRLDQVPLGVTFGSMVAAANYSDLLASGYLVDCTVFAPARPKDKGLAMEPVEAYRKYAAGKCGFVYVRTKSEAKELAESFNYHGISAATITDSTPKKERKELIELLAVGELKILVNIYTLTEGVDIPRAEFVMLARKCSHISMFLQIVGRVLRPFENKDRAYVIDLVGSMKLHGFPTENRSWDIMQGKPDRGEVALVGRECPQCLGYFMRSRICPECGYDFSEESNSSEHDSDRIIYNEELQCYTSATALNQGKSKDEKSKAFASLLRHCYQYEPPPFWYAFQNYRKTFDEYPSRELVTDDVEKKVLDDLIKRAEEKAAHGYYVQKKFKDLTGFKPNFKLVDCELLKVNTMKKMRAKSGGKITRRDRAMFLSIFGR